MHDQRLVNRLQNYWDLIRRGKPLPEIVQLNPSSIDDMWQQCMQLEVSTKAGPPSYRYTHMGEKLIPMFGRDMTGQVLDTRMNQYPYNIISAKMDGVLKSKEYVIGEGHFMNERGRVVKYRACWMPFGNEAKGVTHVVVGLSDREY